MNRRLAIVAVAVGLLAPAGALGQQSVEDCIAQGGPRYANPGDATTHQYVDAGGRCADAQDDSTDVTITPVGGGTSGGKPSRPGNGAQPGGTAPTPAPQPAGGPATSPDVAPTAPKPSRTTPRPKPPKGSGAGPGTPAVTSRGDASQAAVTAALSASSADAGLSSAFSLGSAPGVAIAVLAGLGLAGAGAGMRRLNRR